MVQHGKTPDRALYISIDFNAEEMEGNVENLKTQNKGSNALDPENR